MKPLDIGSVSAAETWRLRAAVLRSGLPLEQNIYPGDDSGRDFHAGAFEGGRLVGVASVFRESPPGEENDAAWRLRGMAVLPAWQRRGYGKALLQACLDHIVRQGGEMLWCNAREDARPFYELQAFEPVGEPFNIPDLGLHYRMRRQLAPGS